MFTAIAVFFVLLAIAASVADFYGAKRTAEMRATEEVAAIGRPGTLRN